MLQSLSFLIRWISWFGIDESTLSILWPWRLRSMPLVTGFEITGSGLFIDEGVEAPGVVVFDAAIAGWAVMVAQVMPGVLGPELVPFVVFDSTRESAGRVAVTACNGPLGGLKGPNLVVRKTLSSFVVLKFSFSVATSFSKGTSSRRVIWSSTKQSLNVSSSRLA